MGALFWAGKECAIRMVNIKKEQPPVATEHCVSALLLKRSVLGFVTFYDTPVCVCVCVCVCARARSVAPSRPTLCNPTDCSPPGTSVHGILQAGILEWVAKPSSGGSSRPRGQACISSVSCTGREVLLPPAPAGKSTP